MKLYFGNTVTTVTTIMTDCKITAYAADMVLCNVRWNYDEDSCNGSGQNYGQNVIYISLAELVINFRNVKVFQYLGRRN